MELNIPNPDARNLEEAFGVTLKRSDELYKAMDDYWKSYGAEAQTVRWQHVISDIAAFCNSTEEIALCLVIHCGQLQYSGRWIIRPQ